MNGRLASVVRLWPTALAVLVLLGAWQLAASTGALADALGLDSFLVPSPAEIGESLWTDRALLAELGTNGNDYVRRKFDRDKIAAEFWDVLQTI